MYGRGRVAYSLGNSRIYRGTSAGVKLVPINGDSLERNQPVVLLRKTDVVDRPGEMTAVGKPNVHTSSLGFR